MSIFANERLEGVHVQAGRALAWWLGELRSAYADAARRLKAIAPNGLTIEAGERHWVLRRKDRVVGDIDWGSGGGEAGRRALRELTTQAGRPGLILVEIPPERVLSKTIELPASARAELDRILLFEIAKHFPFSAERMFYRHRVVGRATGLSAAGTPSLSVEVVAVPRDVVASIAGELAATGQRASHIALRSAPAATPLLLGPEALAAAGPPLAARHLPVAAVLLLALVAAFAWPVAQQVRLGEIRREIATLRPTADAAFHSRDRRRRDIDQADAIARLRAGRPPLIAILDVLSREVPDGAWLTQLSIAGRDIVLEGLSPSAASIALALGRATPFDGVVFRSPIARDMATGLEHFQLGVTIREARR